MSITRSFKEFDEEFIWHNQTIDENLVNFVNVRIYRRANIITSDGTESLIATDAPAIRKSPKGYLYISDHTIAIFSTGIYNKAKAQKPFLYLHIKVCLTDNFDIAKLDTAEFLEKPYVMQAIQGKTTSDPFLSPLLSYFRKKIGSDYEKIYHLLESAAQEYEIDTVEQLFKEYQISGNYQALFWKEMYLQTKNSKNEK